MTEFKYRYIFSQRLAGYLMQRGFTLLSMVKNFNDASKNVFVFKDGDAIVKAVNEYKEAIK